MALTWVGWIVGLGLIGAGISLAVASPRSRGPRTSSPAAPQEAVPSRSSVATPTPRAGVSDSGPAPSAQPAGDDRVGVVPARAGVTLLPEEDPRDGVTTGAGPGQPAPADGEIRVRAASATIVAYDEEEGG